MSITARGRRALVQLFMSQTVLHWALNMPGVEQSPGPSAPGGQAEPRGCGPSSQDPGPHTGAAVPRAPALAPGQPLPETTPPRAAPHTCPCPAKLVSRSLPPAAWGPGSQNTRAWLVSSGIRNWLRPQDSPSGAALRLPLSPGLCLLSPSLPDLPQTMLCPSVTQAARPASQSCGRDSVGTQAPYLGAALSKAGASPVPLPQR